MNSTFKLYTTLFVYNNMLLFQEAYICCSCFSQTHSEAVFCVTYVDAVVCDASSAALTDRRGVLEY